MSPQDSGGRFGTIVRLTAEQTGDDFRLAMCDLTQGMPAYDPIGIGTETVRGTPYRADGSESDLAILRQSRAWSPDAHTVRFSQMSDEAEAEMAEWDAIRHGGGGR